MNNLDSKIKKIVFLIVLLVLPLSAKPRIVREKVVPGVWHEAIYDSTGPWSIHVVEIDLTNPNISIASATAQERLGGNERTSSQVKRVQNADKKVAAAINADFYKAGGIPVGLNVIDGIPLNQPSDRSVFWITDDKTPGIARLTLSGEVRKSDGKTYKLNGVNRARGENEIILYNQYFGSSSGTNRWGSEFEVVFQEAFEAGKVNYGIVQTVAPQKGNTPLPEINGAVLSVHGKSEIDWRYHVKEGDTLAVDMAFEPVTGEISAAVGGIPRIIRNGVISIETEAENIRESFSTTRHPRTAVGFSEDKKKLILMTVDGRQPGFSVGMTLTEEAVFLQQRGCYQAVNLDGGGSTTMVINNQIVNSPSDATGERAVSNSLLVLYTIPE